MGIFQVMRLEYEKPVAFMLIEEIHIHVRVLVDVSACEWKVTRRIYPGSNKESWSRLILGNRDRFQTDYQESNQPTTIKIP